MLAYFFPDSLYSTGIANTLEILWKSSQKDQAYHFLTQLIVELGRYPSAVALLSFNLNIYDFAMKYR